MLAVFRDAVRRYLGTDTIPYLEVTVTSAKAQLDQLTTAFTDFSADVDAKLGQLIAAQGEFTPEAQQVFDSLKAAVADADSKVGDADGSDTPVVAEPGTPDQGNQQF